MINILRHNYIRKIIATVAFFSLWPLCGATNAYVYTHHTNQPLEFDLPEAPLAETLLRFSETAGVKILFNPRLVENLNSPALSGRLTASEALEELLLGANLTYRKIDHDNWAIIKRKVRQPDLDTQTPPVIDTPTPAPLERDEIIVTSSYRAPVHEAGARAIYTLNGEEFVTNGASNVAEPIYKLPASVSSVTSANTALLASTGGLNLADLRGLGAERTLLLVNGRRYVRTNGGVGTVIGVDLNSIPAHFVERIEIINQGAGAALGSEAVAGAINIVTRADVEGLTLTVDGGLSQLGDASEYSISALGGRKLFDDRLRFVGGITYAKEPSLLAPDREFLTRPSEFALNGRRSFDTGADYLRGFGGSSFTPNGLLFGAETTSGELIYGGPSLQQYFFSADGTSYEPYEAREEQLYDWTTDFAAHPKIERVIAYGRSELDTDAGHNLYIEGHYAKTDVKTQIAATPLTAFRGVDSRYGDGIFVPADNPFIPANLIADLEAQTGQEIGGLLLGRRFVELGPRSRAIDRITYQIVAGLNGPAYAGFSYDVSLQYGRNSTTDSATGYVDSNKLQIALNEEECRRVFDCRPIDIFGSNKITPDQAQFISVAPRVRDLEVTELIAQARISGPLFDTDVFELTTSAGFDLRRNTLKDIPQNYGPDSGALGALFFPGSEGMTSFAELYGNIGGSVEINLPLAQSFDFGGAVRRVNRRGQNSFVNVDMSGRLTIINGISFYVEAFRGGRSPNVAELFGGGPNANSVFYDPCAHDTSNPVVAANCTTPGLGVGPGFTQTQLLTQHTYTGNPFLQEEQVHSEIYGVKIDFHRLAPSMSGALSLEADWRNINVDNIPQFVSTRINLSECYASEGLQHPYCGTNPVTGQPYIQRSPFTDQIIILENHLVNTGRMTTSGLDVRARYSTDLTIGKFEGFVSADLLYSYTHRARLYENGGSDEPEIEFILEKTIDAPRHRIFATFSAGTEKAKIVTSVNHRGKVFSKRPDNSDFEIASALYVDTSLQLRLTDDSVFYLGAENLLNRKPPYNAYSTGGTFYEHYDVIGRRFFLGAKTKL